MLGELGAEIIDTDEIARDVVLPGAPGLKMITDTWGTRVLKTDGTLDREALAGIVFADEEQRRELNGMLHPLIAVETRKWIEASKSDVVVMVVPLLFESGMDRMCGQCWVVNADEDLLVRRIMERDGCGAEHARDRIRSQMSQMEKTARADVVIDNSGSLEDTRRIVEEAWNQLEKF